MFARRKLPLTALLVSCCLALVIVGPGGAMDDATVSATTDAPATQQTVTATGSTVSVLAAEAAIGRKRPTHVGGNFTNFSIDASTFIP